MGGAVVFAGQLLPQLVFPLEFDYLHVSRYGDDTRGGPLSWLVAPRTPVAGRVVLLLDDILDEGVTLAEITAWLRAQGASEVLSAVFADKHTGRAKAIAADFVGLRLPDRYVFGFGMDIAGAWRNLPAVYAVKGTQGYADA
jgi:hypoxanthine phosphoribosyltransferase